MTALAPVWTPADFDATVAALKLHQAVSVPGGGVILPPKRGHHYRGRHRANRFSRRVADLQTEIRDEQAYAAFKRNLAAVVRSLGPRGAR